MSTTQRPRTKFKKILRVFTVLLVLLYILLRILLRPPGVHIKSDAERARLPVSVDSYPCLLIDRNKEHPLEPMRANVQQCSPSLNNSLDLEQYEINLRNGEFLLRQTDLFVADSVPLALTRAYCMWDSASRAFGVGGNHSYDIFPVGDRYPYTYMELNLGDGTNIHYDRISEGTSYIDYVAEHKADVESVFQHSRIQWNADHWDMKFRDRTLFKFPEAYFAKRGVDGALIAMQYPSGEEIKFVRDKNHNLQQVTSPHGHWIRFGYDSSNRVMTAADDNNRQIGYSYDDLGRLLTVTESGRARWTYRYTPTGMTTVQDSNGKDLLLNEYSHSRIVKLTLGKRKTYRFDYLLDQRRDVIETIVTDPAGAEKVFRF